MIMCDYCLRDHPRITMCLTKFGQICIGCSAVCWYDGWNRREIELTPKEMQTQYPERINVEI